MSEEFKKEPVSPVSAEAKLDEIIPPREASSTAAAPAAVKKNDPWKTAFIVLAGIAVISAGLFYLVYSKRGDLPMVPATVDAQALPVQMGNPPTGATEQAALAQQVPQVVIGPDGKPTAAPGTPGAAEMFHDGYDPWANPGRFSTGVQPPGSVPYPVTPVGPPGQQVYMESNPNSPFMQDGNMYVMVPAPNANSAVNANKPVPGSSPKAGPGALPTPPPANSAVTNPPAQTAPAGTKPEAKPADTKPAAKPTPARKPSGKPTGTTSSTAPGTGVEKDSE